MIQILNIIFVYFYFIFDKSYIWIAVKKENTAMTSNKEWRKGYYETWTLVLWVVYSQFATTISFSIYHIILPDFYYYKMIVFLWRYVYKTMHWRKMYIPTAINVDIAKFSAFYLLPRLLIPSLRAWI